MTTTSADLTIVGAGIIGLATAYSLTQRFPSRSIVILEKEADVARHQTGNNSGVLHAGLYYKPGSLRATLCGVGKQRMQAFCAEHGIAFELCGKVIVAYTEAELPPLKNILERGVANGVPDVRWIERDELRAIEPHAGGLCAVYSPQTGIVDYKAVSATLRRILEARGVQFGFLERVDNIERGPEGLTIRSSTTSHRSRHLITCGGLYADRMAQLMGSARDIRIVPFRGEYYFLKPGRKYLVRGLIYPVPDPSFPFLGVHFTKTIHGEVEAGPNAVFALAREGYSWGKINLGELADSLGFAGFQKLARKYWRTGLMEIRRSLSKELFVQALQKLIPDLQSDDVVRGGAGVRAQAIGSNGTLVDDFSFVEMPDALHVINAPSPAATASLAIGDYIVDRAVALFGLS